MYMYILLLFLHFRFYLNLLSHITPLNARKFFYLSLKPGDTSSTQHPFSKLTILL